MREDQADFTSRNHPNTDDDLTKGAPECRVSGHEFAGDSNEREEYPYDKELPSVGSEGTQSLEVDCSAHRHEKYRDEELRDIVNLVLDLASPIGPSQNEPRGKRADDDRGADNIGEIGERECEHDRGEEERLGNTKPRDERNETRRKNRSDDDREEDESERDSKRLPHTDDREFLAGRHRADDAEQDEPEDVVDHSRAENHLRLVALQVPEVRQHARRDPDRRRCQRGAQKDRDRCRQPEQRTDAVPRRERQDYAGDSNRQRRPSHRKQTTNVCLESDQEEQEQDAQLRENVDERPVRVDETKARDTDDDATYHLAEHRWLADPFRKLTKQLRRGKDHQKRNE